MRVMPSEGRGTAPGLPAPVGSLSASQVAQDSQTCFAAAPHLQWRYSRPARSMSSICHLWLCCQPAAVNHITSEGTICMTEKTLTGLGQANQVSVCKATGKRWLPLASYVAVAHADSAANESLTLSHLSQSRKQTPFTVHRLNAAGEP